MKSEAIQIQNDLMTTRRLIKNSCRQAAKLAPDSPFLPAIIVQGEAALKAETALHTTLRAAYEHMTGDKETFAEQAGDETEGIDDKDDTIT